MLIGIAGKSRSGKDTCADFIVEGRNAVKVAFADPMKRICADVFLFTRDQLWGPSESRNVPDKLYPRDHSWGSNPKDGLHTCKCCGATCQRGAHPATECYLTPRYALQQLGTEWGRNCSRDIWVDYVVRVHDILQRGGYEYDPQHGIRIANPTAIHAPAKEIVLVPDVRHLNEIEELKARGAKLIRVVRPDANAASYYSSHSSEAVQESIPDSLFDAVILNDQTLEKFRERILILLEEWGVK